MCDFHLRGNCFHPEKVERGFVANSCNVHDCLHCTNTKWQQNKIQEELAYYTAILNLAELSEQEPMTTIIQAKSTTPLDVQKENRFKSPFKLFSGKKKVAEEQ